MAASVHVTLLSGRCCSLCLEGTATMEEVKLAAQEALQQPFLQLVPDDPNVPNPFEASFTALASIPIVVASERAFALWVNGAVVSWGNPRYGGEVKYLTEVTSLRSSKGAFCALRSDGSVVCWGKPAAGGDCAHVQVHLHEVQQIASSDGAFAALRSDGRVVSWGDDHCGGDSSCVQDQLQGIEEIFGASKAFVAMGNGTTVTWGHHLFGGDSSSVQARFHGVKVERLAATWGAVAALLADGRVVTWGDARQGGDSSAVQDQLRNVTDLAASAAAFAAIADGRLVTWGHPDFGGENPNCRHSGLQQSSLRSLCASAAAFGAIMADGSLITWGHPRFGGLSTSASLRHSHNHSVIQLVAPVHHCAVGFAALLSDGSVTTWGHSHGTHGCVQGIRMLLGVSGGAYVALTTNGQLKVWGDETAGGDSSQVHELLQKL